MVHEKQARRLPIHACGAAIIGSVLILIYWFSRGPNHEANALTDIEPRRLQGPYRLLRSDNISTEPSPYPMELLGVDDFHRLIEINDFSFTMNDAAVLCNVTNSPLVVAVVHSKPNHFLHRVAIRKTWGRDIDLVFMVGITDNKTQQRLNDENLKHNDIVQGSFVDSYRNLTYKHVMGLKWVSYFCPTARYVLKLDDDVFVNTRNLHDLLMRQLSQLGARSLILCKILPSSVAKRTYRSKWRVTPAEYPGRWYPGYCPGWAVLYSPDVVFKLYREAQRSPYFWIDDVHITGTMVMQANLTHTLLGQLSYLWNDENYDSSKSKSNFVVLLTSQYSFKEIWESLDS